MILLWLGCTPKAPPVAHGPHGLACEGRTAVLVDPDPWAAITTLDVRSGDVSVTTTPSQPVILTDAQLHQPITLTLGSQTCTLTPAGTGGETGICGSIGVALHYTPLCELLPVVDVITRTETLLLDTRRRCLLDTHGYREIETANGAHQTCGGRPPGDHQDGVITAIPTQAAFPWLTP